MSPPKQTMNANASRGERWFKRLPPSQARSAAIAAIEVAIFQCIERSSIQFVGLAMKSCFVFADRIRGQGVIIEFDDGTSALYSASLLRSMLPDRKSTRLNS